MDECAERAIGRHPAVGLSTFADFGIDVPSGRSGEVRAICPKCSPTRKRGHQREKDLAVNTLDGSFYCHHCGWSGGLGGQMDWRDKPPRVYAKPEPPREDPPEDAVTAWFAGRGIPAAVLEANRVTSEERFCPQCAKPVRTIVFPYTRDGEVVHVKYRCGKKHFWSSKDTERIVYGEDGLAGAELWVIVEGEIDKLSVEAASGPPTISVPDGAPAANAQNLDAKLSFLAGIEAYKDAARVIVIGTDMDAPGEALAEALARRFDKRKCFRVRWPEGCKDANDTLVTLGPEAVLRAINDAEPYPVEGVMPVRSFAADVLRLYDEGFDRGATVGWPVFDTLCRAREQLFTVITGSPGSGKSVWLDNWVIRLADQHDWVIGVCSPENQPLARHAGSLLALKLGKPFSDGPTPRMTREEAAMALEWLDAHFVFVLPEEPTVATVLERAKTLVYRYGIRGLIVDPWNELDHARQGTVPMHEHVSAALREFRKFALDEGVMVWLVAHPRKLQKREDGLYPVATPYDIADSAAFFNRADFCISVWRNPQDQGQPTEVHIQKVRFAETGQVGMAPFRYDRATGRVWEMEQLPPKPAVMQQTDVPWE